MKPETTTRGADPEQSPAHRTMISRLAELLLWGLFPFALVVVMGLTSVILEIRDPELPILITFGIVLAAGLCLLIWPQRKHGLGRKRGALLVILGLVVFAPAAYMASLTPQQRADLRAEAEERAAEARETQVRAARRETTNTAQRDEEAASSSVQQEPELPVAPSAEAQASFVQTHTRFMRLANLCDTAWDEMTEAIGGDNIYASYRAADQGADICRDASWAMRRLEFSDPIERDARRALNRAVDECSYALVGKQSAMEQAAGIFDGNVRPSAVEGFRRRASLAQQQSIQCMVQYIGAATDGGYEVQSLESDAELPARP